MHPIRSLIALAFAALLLAAPAAPAASTSTSAVVVSQVFAGGGNTGASFTHDFVELFNRGSSTVDLTGWTVQYASAASTSWQLTAVAGSIEPGHYYLVQLASAAAVGAPLPTADAAGTSNLAVSGGKVALVRDSTALACGAAVGSCSAVATVEDFFGYGSATDYEGAGAGAGLSSTTAAARADAGCTDTDSSSADFSAAAPSPRNSSSVAASCGTAPPVASGSAPAAVDIDIQPVLSISLERPAVSFGNAVAGDTPAPISEQVTVVSNNQTGYTLTVRRSAFAPVDLPLGISGTAPAGAQLGAPLTGGTRAPIPVTPAADLIVGTSSAGSAATGDVWPTTIGFTSSLPIVPPGRYTATVTYTVIGR